MVYAVTPIESTLKFTCTHNAHMKRIMLLTLRVPGKFITTIKCYNDVLSLGNLVFKCWLCDI